MTRAITGLLSVFLLISPVFALASGREDIHARAELVQPLLAGMRAPDFTVRDVRGQPFRFEAGKIGKPLVLTFFRGGWCPYCNLHLSELRLAEKQLRDMGFAIWFISLDKPALLLASLEDPNIGYTIFSDSSLQATRAFGIAFHVDDETFDRYRTYDVDLEKASGEMHHVLPAPSTFIIGRDGVISFSYTNPDYKVRLAPDVLLAAARSYLEDADKRLVTRRRQALKKEAAQ